MSHDVGEGTLEHPLRRRIAKWRPPLQVAAEVLQYPMEARDLIFEAGQDVRPVGPANEVRTGVAEDTGHVAQELVWGPDPRGGAEFREIRRSALQPLLGPVR